MEGKNQDLLIEGAKAFGIHLDKKAIESFDLYLRELLKWNQKINLTSIRSEKGIVLKHFLDSLFGLPSSPKKFFYPGYGVWGRFSWYPLENRSTHP
jgi:16S rRNA G527 N7-methylase RsmG